MPVMLDAAAMRSAAMRQIVIAGDPRSAGAQALLRVVNEHVHADQVVLPADGGDGQRLIAQHVAAFSAMTPLGGQATAYVSAGGVRQEPVTAPADLARLLDQAPPPATP
jgi:uncharacterized protein YyaL (SSP411 family)